MGALARGLAPTSYTTNGDTTQADAGGCLGDGCNLCPQFEPGTLVPGPVDEMVGKANRVETKLLDFAAAAQKFGPRHVWQHEYGEPELAGHVFSLFLTGQFYQIRSANL